MSFKLTMFIIPFSILLLACNTDLTDVNTIENNPQEERDLEVGCPYDSQNDISDSLILLFDEIMQKESDFNDEKYNSSMKDWGGKSITLHNLKVHILPKPGVSEKSSVVLEYATKDKGRVGRTDIHLFVRLDRDELKNYSYGDRVTLKGVLPYIDADYVPKSKSDQTLALYYIHLDCGSLE
jgi:hypothetical protein